ncbi:hypothetical protein [Paenibacillus guangzhouensis]|uniref:hypothetical protein n=1 Tax=Paenibacillus guangzhouensis TaxID=1473112 RepID=UPI0012677D65|nr:hypothetical protein [Paenibacillus guangzhouensis]
MKKWMMVWLITIVASLSACSSPDSGEKGSMEATLTVEQDQQEQGHEVKENNKMENEAAEQGVIKVFSNLMSLKLPAGLEVQSNETSNTKLIYTDSDKKAKLEIWHDPEQRVTDADIDRGRLKMKGILEQEGEGEKLEWLKDETMLIHGKHIAVNEVIMPSKKGDTYRLVGWAELDGAFLEMKFSAPADEKDTWQKAVMEMIESIQMP